MERYQVSRQLDVTRYPELSMTRNPFSRKQTLKSSICGAKFGQQRTLESIKWIRLLFNRIKEMADGRNWDYDFQDCGGEGDMAEEFTDLMEEEFNR